MTDIAFCNPWHGFGTCPPLVADVQYSRGSHVCTLFYRGIPIEGRSPSGIPDELDSVGSFPNYAQTRGHSGTYHAWFALQHL